MEWKAEYTKDKPFVTIVTEGRFSVEDHARLVEDIVTRDFWKPGMDVLFDHRNLDFGFTTIDFMKQASANHETQDERIGNGKAAILMKSLADFGRGRQFEIISSNKVSARIKIFMDEESAINWLLEEKILL